RSGSGHCTLRSTATGTTSEAATSDLATSDDRIMPLPQSHLSDSCSGRKHRRSAGMISGASSVSGTYSCQPSWNRQGNRGLASPLNQRGTAYSALGIGIGFSQNAGSEKCLLEPSF